MSDSYEANWQERQVYEDSQEMQQIVIRETEWLMSGSKLDQDLWHRIQSTKTWRI